MGAKLKAVWSSLPHYVQAGLFSVGSAFLITFVHALSEGGCYSSTCLKHYLGTALAAAVAAASAYYTIPNKGAPK